MLQSLARTCYRRRRTVLALWLLLVVGLNVVSGAFKGAFENELDLPGSDSQAAFDLLKRTGFADRSGFSGQIVFEARGGVDDPTVRDAMTDLFARVERSVRDVSVVSPYSDEGARQVSRDQTIAYAEVNLADRSNAGFRDAADTVKSLAETARADGLRIELGGDLFAEAEFGGSEGIGLLAAVVILLLAFGSLLAMGLPLLTAAFGIGSGLAVVGLFANFIDMPDFTSQAASMIGIGVGIDYALFIVTRYRQSLRDGRDAEASVVMAMDTAGRAVLFAGITVVIALLGMITVGLSIPIGVAIGSSLAVLFTMFAALTLLPAVLGFTGRNIDRFRVGRRAPTGEGPVRESFWHRWSRVIQRRPWPAFVGALVVLLALAWPVLSLRLGFADAGNRPTSDTTRRAYDLLSEGFGPGFNGPMLLAAETPNGASDVAALGKVAAAVGDAPGVVLATPPLAGPSGKAAIVQVFPATSPQDTATTKLVHRLRDEVIPTAVASSGSPRLDVHVGGATAAVEDFASFTGRRMPVFMGAVLLLSFLLLLWVFRSILVPLKAVIMNLLSIGAAYGVIVVVFQFGWGRALVGVGKEGPVEAWAPMMLFAVVFGLSMDYEVFLLSRIREEYDRSGDNALAVADGLAATARVITAAAAIMFFVFGSFVLNSEYALKLFGLGLAVAVLVDATIVRLVLVPATMELLGDRNWWLPRWLDRVLPVVHVEPTPDHFADGQLAEPSVSL